MPRRPSPPTELREALAAFPSRLGGLAAGTSPEALAAPPAPGEWSVVEVLAHLRSCADVWGDAMAAILAEDHPTIRAVSPRSHAAAARYATLRFSASLAGFSRQREHLVARLASLREDEWDRAATVVGAGAPLTRTVRDYADRLARHERGHLRQVQATLRSVSA